MGVVGSEKRSRYRAIDVQWKDRMQRVFAGEQRHAEESSTGEEEEKKHLDAWYVLERMKRGGEALNDARKGLAWPNSAGEAPEKARVWGRDLELR